MVPGCFSRVFQELRDRAIEFLGCSKEKALPSFDLEMQSSAAISAILVSNSSFNLFAFGNLATTWGIPLGCSELLRGFGANFTPGIGRSLAREKLEQFGAQWAKKHSISSEFKVSCCVKTSRPRSKSHGSPTFFLPVNRRSAVLDLPPESLVAFRPGRSCP